jgi:aminoglycoside phosphotransferase (APT) family kinase protein
MEFLKGRVLADNNLPNIPINQRPSYWFEAVRALSELHLTKFESIGLKDYGPNGNFYNRQFKVLSKISQFQSEVFDQNGNQPVPKLPRLEELPKIWSKFNLKDEVSVMHGDYKLDNIIFHTEECKVIGILDWELSTIGHPLYDLSTLLLWFYVPADKGGLDVSNSGLPPNFVDELIKHYCKLTNRPYPIQNWKACLGFSVFKYAVIFQGIAARLALGQASSANAKLVSDNTVPMGELALKFFEQAELELNKNKL